MENNQYQRIPTDGHSRKGNWIYSLFFLSLTVASTVSQVTESGLEFIKLLLCYGGERCKCSAVHHSTRFGRSNSKSFILQ
jgi:hypothetical protein